MGTYPFNMPKERIELSLDSEVIKQLRYDAIKRYNNLRSVSRLIEDMVRANTPKPDIQAIKKDREKYVAEEIERYRNMPGNTRLCGLDVSTKCNTCDNEFDTIPGEANFCPACSGRDLRFMNKKEDTIYGRIREAGFTARQQNKEAQKKNGKR